MEQPDDPFALVLGDRLASLGTLVACVAHEVNNPITYVIGCLSELERVCQALTEAVAGYRGVVRGLPEGPERVRGLARSSTPTRCSTRGCA